MSSENELHQLIVKELQRLNDAVIDLSKQIQSSVNLRLSSLEVQDASTSAQAINLAERVSKLENNNTWLWRSLATIILGMIAGLIKWSIDGK